MSIVRLVGVYRYVGARRLFGPVTASVEPGDRIGLIGPNGSGKSTLLRLIAGIDPPDEGEVYGAQRAQKGFMRQEPEFAPDETPYRFVLGALAHLTEWAERMRALEEAMSRETDSEALDALLAQYAAVSERFEREGGYEADALIRSTLFGLGLEEGHLHRPLQTLSGGERARAALARLLVTQPDLLILDEPTNHLDIKATEWLEDALRKYPGSLIVVSHDRYFLDAVATKIWELDGLGGFFTYRGNYTAAMAQREAERQRRLKEYEAQQEEIERLEAYVRRYKAGNRAAMAKSRERRLERMERIEPPKADPTGPRLIVTQGLRGSREVVRLEDVGHSYGERRVLEGVTAVLARGDRMAILGPNGAGKSTLLAIIAGRLQPTHGAAYMGRDIQVGYYAQHTEGLEPGRTVIEELLAAKHMTTPEARAYLARFLFRGEDVFKPVAALSGGEKRRLMLAKLLLSPVNLLCLDEPTNHLDLPARESLEEALSAYEGTLVFVSHDRYFISRLATRLAVVHGGGRVEFFDGGYEAYQEHLRRLAEAARPAEQEKRAATGARRVERKDAASLARRIAEAEALIERLEQEKAELEQSLADPQLYGDAERARQTALRHRTVTEQLEAAYAEWEALAADLPAQQ